MRRLVSRKRLQEQGAPDRVQAAQWVVEDDTPRDLDALRRQCRSLVTRHALVAAGAAAVPVPGLDVAADMALLARLIPRINAEFGLTPAQIELLSPHRKVAVYKAITAVGGAMIGRVVTQELALHVLKLVGVRITVRQASRYVPLAGQAMSAALSFTALRYVCNLHIEQCMAVSRQLLQLPAPNT
jgi:uncharacterized protein (DUF697 family)